MALFQVSGGQEMYQPVALALDNAGVLHVAWRDVDGSLKYRRRDTRFQPLQTLAATDNAHAAFEMQGGEVVALQWAHRGTRYDVWRADMQGTTFGNATQWIPDAKMPQPAGSTVFFSRAVSRTGFVWQRDGAGSLQQIHEGAFPRAALAPDGQVHVVWFSNAPGSGIFLDGHPVVEGQVQQHPHLAVGSAGQVHLVWARGEDFTIWYQRRLHEPSRVQLAKEFKATRFPRIAVDANDNLHVVFQGKEKFVEQAKERWKIYHIVRQDKVWSAPRRVSTGDVGSPNNGTSEYQFPNLVTRNSQLAIGFWDSTHKVYWVELSDV